MDSDTYQGERATLFGQWVMRMLQHANASRLALARMLDSKDMLALRPKKKDDKRIHEFKLNTPKQEVGKYCAGKMMPGAIVAFRIGAALERMGAPCSGLDALIMAQKWHDAIGCIGEYIRASHIPLGYDYNPNTGLLEEYQEEQSMATDVFACRLHGLLPEAMRPAMEQAWIKWLTYKDPSRLPARIEGAYVLAASPYEKDQSIAKYILSQQWEPPGLVLDRNPKRDPSADPKTDVEEDGKEDGE